MTFRCPSFLASATSALMPPQEAVELHVAKFVELLLPEPAADELLELPELLHPAARTTVPNAATVATIALFARKAVPPMPPPGEAGLVILARQVLMVTNECKRKVADW